MTRRTNTHEIFSLVAWIALWLTVVSGGTYYALLYDNSPGAAHTTTSMWPQGLQFTPDKNKDTLVMLIHPKCSCSRASLGELARIVAEFPDNLRVYVLYVTFSGNNGNWEFSEARATAQSIPGVTLIDDVDGKISKQFGAETSGYTLLYNQSGSLLFSGGITASRGHWGDNTGTQAVSAILTNGEVLTRKTAVFGCDLFSKNREVHNEL